MSAFPAHARDLVDERASETYESAYEAIVGAAAAVPREHRLDAFASRVGGDSLDGAVYLVRIPRDVRPETLRGKTLDVDGEGASGGGTRARDAGRARAWAYDLTLDGAETSVLTRDPVRVERELFIGRDREDVGGTGVAEETRADGKTEATRADGKTEKEKKEKKDIKDKKDKKDKKEKEKKRTRESDATEEASRRAKR